MTIQNLSQPFPDPQGHQAYQALNPPQPFIDREKERTALFNAMVAGEVRLICGLGGVGKTALALRVAQDLADAGKFPEGILWIPLEGNPAPETVAVWVLGAFGMKPEGNPLDAMARVLNLYCPLLILDNAEAAPQTADAILECRGNAAMLVTSRDARIGLNAIPGLPDDLEPMEDADAVNLLRSRLGSMKIEDDQAGELNKLVGGLPLALVLAAGFITRTLRRDPRAVDTYLNLLRLSPLTALELDHRRERSIQVTFDLSWKRLDKFARQVMAVLASLPGESADLPALSTVLEKDPQAVQTRLWTLGDFSLVIQEGKRWRLHPLVRIYTGNKMQGSEAAALRERLQRYYLDYAVQGNEENQYGEHLDAERDNVLGAMTWAWEEQNWHIVIAFAGAIDLYLRLRGYSNVRLERAKWYWSAAFALQNRQEEANALQSLGSSHHNLSQYPETREYIEKAISIYHVIGDPLGEANSLQILADMHWRLSEYEAAQGRYEEALALCQATGHRLGEAKALQGLGDICRILPDYAKARERYEAALLIYQILGDQLGEESTLRSLGDVHRMLSEYAIACKRYKAALPICRAIGTRLGEASTLRGLGDVSLHLAEYAAAQEYFEEALSIYQSIGARLGEANLLWRLGDVQRMLSEYEGARNKYQEALTIYQAIGTRLGEANALWRLGIVRIHLGEQVVAREYIESALVIYRAINARVGEADALRSLGDLARNAGNWEHASQLYQQTLEISRKVNDRYGTAHTTAMLGRLAADRGQRDRAIELYREALELYGALGLTKGRVSTVQSWLDELSAPASH